VGLGLSFEELRDYFLNDGLCGCRLKADLHAGRHCGGFIPRQSPDERLRRAEALARKFAK
jgi:hypothetical protein